MKKKQQYKCLVDNKETELLNGMFFSDLSSGIKRLIRKDYPRVQDTDFICSEHLIHYRLVNIDNMYKRDMHQNAKLNNKLTGVMENDKYQIIDVSEKLQKSLTFGQRVADAVAHFGGSWTFIISFILIMIVWIIINLLHVFGVSFDPYPFILLNLFLSMVAAIQAPLILMSQNRSDEYEQMQSQNDYHVNLKSEEEIRMLHSKLDHLIQQDQPNLLEIQRIQTEMLASIEQQVSELRKKDDPTESDDN